MQIPDPPMKPSRYLIPFAIASALFAAVLALLIRHGLHQDGGIFVYPLDDAYIHMAVARNLALHGVWGISPTAFSGASSSVAWTLLLAACTRLFGTHLLTPLLLNILAAETLLLLAACILARRLPKAGTPFLSFALCAMTLCIPLPGLALISMEHVLHSIAILAFVALAAKIASQPEASSTPAPTAILLLLSAIASGALRYESCFTVAAVCLLLLIRKRIVLAVVTGLVSAIGPAGYALYSYKHSGVMLPFSVVMKSTGSAINGPFDILTNGNIAPVFVLLWVLLTLHIARRSANDPAPRPPLWTYTQSFATIAFVATLLHAMAGPLNWLMRYEAYLYALDFVAIALILGEYFASRRQHAIVPGNSGSQQLVYLAICFALLPSTLQLVHRAHHGYTDIAVSIRDRFVAHLQQAQFVAQAMPNATVVANDIGFLAYYAPNVTILDPLGLGSIEPVNLTRAHKKVDPAFVRNWADKNNAQLAIIHTDFPGADALVPAGWVLVESWCFPHNLVFQNHVETFYAPDETYAQQLRQQLAAFHPTAPELVRYRFPQDGTTPPEPARGETTFCPVPASHH